MSESHQVSHQKQQVRQDQSKDEKVGQLPGQSKKHQNNQLAAQYPTNTQKVVKQNQATKNNQKLEEQSLNNKKQNVIDQSSNQKLENEVLLNENLANKQEKANKIDQQKENNQSKNQSKFQKQDLKKQQSNQQNEQKRIQPKQEQKQSNDLENIAQKEKDSSNILFQVFKALDTNRDHQISAQEVRILAQQLKVQLSESDIRDFIKEADTDGDMQISFPEFEKWWSKRKQSKVNKIVALVNLQSRILTKAKSLTQKNQKLKQEIISENTDKLNIHIQLGQQNVQNRIKFDFMLAGNKLEAQKARLKQIQLNLHNRQMLFILQINSKNPQEGKKNFNIQFDKLKKRQFKNEILKVLQVQAKALQSSFLVQFSAPSLDHSFSQFIQFLSQTRLNNGPHAFGNFTIDIGFKANIEGRQNQPFVQWLAQGFTLDFKAQGNAEYLKIFKSVFQSELSQYLSILTLFKSSNINLKFKSPQSVHKFFEKLGILQLSQQTPTLSQTLSSIREIFKFLGITHEDHKQLSFVSDILEIASKITGNGEQMSLWVHVGSLMVRLALSSDNIELLAGLFLKNKQ